MAFTVRTVHSIISLAGTCNCTSACMLLFLTDTCVPDCNFSSFRLTQLVSFHLSISVVLSVVVHTIINTVFSLPSNCPSCCSNSVAVPSAC